MSTKKETEDLHLVIPPPNTKIIEILVRGTAPYVQHKFSKKAREKMMATQMAGSTAKSRKKREPRDFEADYEAAKHISEEGWLGIPAPAFRAGMIDACRTAGFVMTKAKMSVFVLPDGFDNEDGTPLVRFLTGEPELHVAMVRNETGVADIRARPMWRKWEAMVRVQFDADQFTAADVTNLLDRVGRQVGIGEGRPFSKKSNGQGWGLFEIVNS